MEAQLTLSELGIAMLVHIIPFLLVLAVGAYVADRFLEDRQQ